MNEKPTYKKECVAALFPENMKSYFYKIIDAYQSIAEIRIRKNGPVQILSKGKFAYLNQGGELCIDAGAGICFNADEFDELFRHICRHSVYAFEQELKNGYLTVEGGHRIGVVGQTVWAGNTIIGIKNFNALNIRIAHEIKGASDGVLPFVFEEGELKSTLIVSLPGCGKTTLLRDVIRKISNGSKYGLPLNVSLIDERSEIASSYLGIAQNDIGRHTDVLDSCPKAAGIMMVLRSMSPQVIAVDELGGEADYNALLQAFYLGCRIVATIHGVNYETLRKNVNMQGLLQQGCFERIVFLQPGGMPGTIKEICNEKGEVIWS